MQKGILFTVLNWGLGHASRSTPIIKSLIDAGHKITIASDGDALSFLQTEFPNHDFIELPGYKANYAAKKSNFNTHILKQIPHFMATIQKEHNQIALLSDQFDLVISDNRYGCYFKDKRSIFIGHQLNILFPESRLVASIINKVHRKKLDQFNEIWIPDDKERTLSGKLSKGFEKKSKFINISSRMSHLDLPKKYDVCVLLSGPEPQRSILEKKLVKLLKSSEWRVLFIRGLIHPKSDLAHSNFEVHNFLTGESLNNVLNKSEMVICRSGYSSIMDLMVLNKKALLVPTPGQSEQEYLAKHLSNSPLFDWVEQLNLSQTDVQKVQAKVQPKKRINATVKKNLIE